VQATARRAVRPPWKGGFPGVRQRVRACLPGSPSAEGRR
jgi:hypothetical protein